MWNLGQKAGGSESISTLLSTSDKIWTLLGMPGVVVMMWEMSKFWHYQSVEDVLKYSETTFKCPNQAGTPRKSCADYGWYELICIKNQFTINRFELPLFLTCRLQNTSHKTDHRFLTVLCLFSRSKRAFLQVSGYLEVQCRPASADARHAVLILCLLSRSKNRWLQQQAVSEIPDGNRTWGHLKIRFRSF